LGYDGERADALALDQLEAVLREVADELAGWRARALKAEAQTREGGGKSGGTARLDAEARSRVADLESENRELRQHVSAARERVQGLLARMTFLEDQAREAEGNGARRSAR
jgi:chromosome segregation ATPase